MPKDDDIFSDEYKIGSQTAVRKLETPKEILDMSGQITQESREKYGVNKPTRKKIRAIISEDD